MRALSAVKLHPSLNQVSQLGKLSQLLVEIKHLQVDLLDRIRGFGSMGSHPLSPVTLYCCHGYVEWAMSQLGKKENGFLKQSELPNPCCWWDHLSARSYVHPTVSMVSVWVVVFLA
jgi:hypothetical protein